MVRVPCEGPEPTGYLQRNETTSQTMGYTFYGDLLGVGGLYGLSPKVAAEKLNEFYNTVFLNLDEAWQRRTRAQVMMFSDSFFMWSDSDEEGALTQLGWLYLKLLHKGLLLRGSIVDGTLRFEPRLERRNFEKRLPRDDTLARALVLEKSHKGARLLIESRLAVRMLRRNVSWQSADGYIREPRPRNPHVPYESSLRRISPTPEGGCYEYLHFWAPERQLNHDRTDYAATRRELRAIGKMLSDTAGMHYRETVRLLGRCQSRHKFTDNVLP
jgi:hypothetical protein